MASLFVHLPEQFPRLFDRLDAEAYLFHHVGLLALHGRQMGVEIRVIRHGGSSALGLVQGKRACR
ncbi:MAG TPA: hypothetical protein VH684_09820 [Xanthobacteraceae bacterium]